MILLDAHAAHSPPPSLAKLRLSEREKERERKKIVEGKLRNCCSHKEKQSDYRIHVVLEKAKV